MLDLEANMCVWLVGQGHPSEKYELVSWDDEIPNIWKNKKWQPNHQPCVCVWFFTNKNQTWILPATNKYK